MKTKLTPKQEAFYHAYLKTGNASKANRTAYSTNRMKHTTVKRKAKFLLDHEKIRVTIGQLQREFNQTSNIKKRRVLWELSAILLAKITDFIECKGSTFVLKELSLLPEEMVRAIETIKHTRYGIEIKLQSKLTTIERICKMLGYDSPDKYELTSEGKPVGFVMVLPSNGRKVV